MNRDQGLNTEITDKLFLELSQFTTARTAREIDLQQRLDYAEMKLAGVKQQRDVEHVSYINEFEKNKELHAQIMELLGVIEYAYNNYDKEGFEWERLLKVHDSTTTQNGKGE
jgi:hypothetical protein